MGETSPPFWYVGPADEIVEGDVEVVGQGAKNLKAGSSATLLHHGNGSVGNPKKGGERLLRKLGLTAAGEKTGRKSFSVIHRITPLTLTFS